MKTDYLPYMEAGLRLLLHPSLQSRCRNLFGIWTKHGNFTVRSILWEWFGVEMGLDVMEILDGAGGTYVNRMILDVLTYLRWGRK